MSRGRGCHLHSTPHKLDHFALVHTAIGATPGQAPAYAPSSDLSDRAPQDHLDQGSTGTCGGHAIAVWIAIALAYAGVSLDFSGVPSPHGIISATYRIEQPGDAPLKDTGVEPADPLLAIARTGVRAMEENATPDGRFSDCVGPGDVRDLPGALPNIQLRPTAPQDIAAQHNRLVGAYAIEPSDTLFTALLAACLTQERPVAACIFVDSAFEAWGEDSPPATKAPLDGHPDWNDPNGGGHYVVIVAHKTVTAEMAAEWASQGVTIAVGTLVFLIWNSWGNGWGCPSPARPDRGGNIWVTETRLRAMTSESYAGALQRLPAPPPAQAAA